MNLNTVNIIFKVYGIQHKYCIHGEDVKMYLLTKKTIFNLGCILKLSKTK